MCSLLKFVTLLNVCPVIVFSLCFGIHVCVLSCFMFKIRRERVMCELLVGLNLGSSLG